MIKTTAIMLALLTLTASAAAADPLGESLQGRPHAQGTPGKLLLYRSHLTEQQYMAMRARNERASPRRY